MVLPGENPLPDSAFKTPQSLREAPRHVAIPLMTTVFDHEIHLLMGFHRTTNLDMYQMLVSAAEKQRLLWTDAKYTAAIEASAYLFQYPQLLFITPEFPQCYRFLRTAELMGEIGRGGETLLVGSGNTLHELLGLYLSPPPEEMLRSYYETDMERFYPGAKTNDALNAFETDEQPIELPLLPGKAHAIEPNPSALEAVKHTRKYITFPDEKLTYYPITIGEALKTALIPKDLDTVLWYRADPEIFISAKGKPHKPFSTYENRRNISQILRPLCNSLRDYGSFILTVGIGNSQLEEDVRLEFMRALEKRLPSMDLYPTPNIPLVFQELEDKFLFDFDTGNIGGLVAYKWG